MAGKVFSHLGTFLKNVGKRAKRVAKRAEGPGEAWRGLLRDLRLLCRDVLLPEQHVHDYKKAIQLVQRGRSAYNKHNYEKADDLFRRAILIDGKCALAYTYLGHTLYQKGRRREAVAYWNRAIEVDPESEAASKARQKLQVVERQTDEILDRLQGERMGRD